MAVLPVVFAKIFVIYIANLRANREIWNKSTPKGKRQFLTRYQVFLSLLFTVRDSDGEGNLGARRARNPHSLPFQQAMFAISTRI